jgi:hypothetical protein
MAKTLDDVAKSRDARERVRKLLGCIPESILLYDKADKAMDLLVEDEGRDYQSTGFGADNPNHKHRSLFMLSGCGARWGALSRFPQNVGRVLLKLYSNRGQTVVDPFAGHNSRMELCWRSGRNYIGCDISKVFMEANVKLRELLLTQNSDSMFPKMNKATIDLHLCDSRKMEPVKNSAGDFTITSPPYWCLEDYGDEMQQLGKSDYPEFLRGLGQVAKSNFRCLKAGSFCVWFVNDFRWEGKFYAYHMHTAQLLRDAGFKAHDTAIVDLGGSFGQAFASQIVDNKILPKRHEYALVFRKP